MLHNFSTILKMLLINLKQQTCFHDFIPLRLQSLIAWLTFRFHLQPVQPTDYISLKNDYVITDFFSSKYQPAVLFFLISEMSYF